MTNIARPGDPTELAEIKEAQVAHDADREPTEEEAKVADQVAAQPEMQAKREQVAEHYQEMAERGAQQKGEGSIE